jgi:hypothetical protein
MDRPSAEGGAETAEGFLTKKEALTWEAKMKRKPVSELIQKISDRASFSKMSSQVRPVADYYIPLSFSIKINPTFILRSAFFIVQNNFFSFCMRPIDPEFDAINRLELKFLLTPYPVFYKGFTSSSSLPSLSA